jgi:hypothetical protein
LAEKTTEPTRRAPETHSERTISAAPTQREIQTVILHQFTPLQRRIIKFHPINIEEMRRRLKL